MLAAGEKRMGVDHSSGAAQCVWCLVHKTHHLLLPLTKPMSPPPFSPNLFSPKQCSALQLQIMAIRLQFLVFS